MMLNNLDLENDIKKIENTNDFSLNNNYKKFLIQNNNDLSKRIFAFNPQKNLNTEIDCLFLLNQTKDSNLLYQHRMFAQRIPSNMIPIGEDCVTNLILLSVKGPDYGKVYYWDHELETEPADYSNLTLIANSFEEFINNLKSEDELENAQRNK